MTKLSCLTTLKCWWYIKRRKNISLWMECTEKLFFWNCNHSFYHSNCFRGVTEWPCRVIPQEKKLSDLELDAISEWLNERHDSGSIHAIYWERVKVVERRMQLPQFQTSTAHIDWEKLQQSFVNHCIFSLTFVVLSLVFKSQSQKNWIPSQCTSHQMAGVYTTGYNSQRNWRKIALYSSSFWWILVSRFESETNAANHWNSAQ